MADGIFIGIDAGTPVLKDRERMIAATADKMKFHSDAGKVT